MSCNKCNPCRLIVSEPPHSSRSVNTAVPDMAVVEAKATAHEKPSVARPHEEGEFGDY